MIALFFEVTPKPGQQDRYLEIAASLRPDLETSGGVVFLDRFRSLSRPATLLSHQIWADDASLTRWRANGCHYRAQVAGRQLVFQDYRLRVAAVTTFRDADARVTDVDIGRPYNDPARQPERWMLVVRSSGAPFAALAGAEIWQSVYDTASFAAVADAPSRAAGRDALAAAAEDSCVSAAHLVLVSRDYGMFDRREAPQYFPSSAVI